jgi:polygalacturonase
MAAVLPAATFSVRGHGALGGRQRWASSRKNDPSSSPNTDGIAPESCRNVHISGGSIDVGDGRITIRSGADVHGGVAAGSEMSGGARNVTGFNCVFQNTNTGIRLKSQRGCGGVVEGVVVDNIAMQDVPEAIAITAFYHGSGTADERHPVDEGAPQFRGIRFSNSAARGSKSAGQASGPREMPISGISFANVHVAAAKGLVVKNLRGVSIGQSWAAPGTRAFVRVTGGRSRGIALTGNARGAAPEPLSFGGGAGKGIAVEK